mgnify:CR=1 FL=1
MISVRLTAAVWTFINNSPCFGSGTGTSICSNTSTEPVIAAENAHVSRYLMVSAVYADEPAKWPESMTDYYITKHYADEWLKRTNLDFVILQPVTLTNDEEVTSIQLTKPNEKASKTITRSTVAAVLAALVEETDISRTTLVLSEGSKELNTAFKFVPMTLA